MELSEYISDIVDPNLWETYDELYALVETVKYMKKISKVTQLKRAINQYQICRNYKRNIIK